MIAPTRGGCAARVDPRRQIPSPRDRDGSTRTRTGLLDLDLLAILPTDGNYSRSSKVSPCSMLDVPQQRCIFGASS